MMELIDFSAETTFKHENSTFSALSKNNLESSALKFKELLSTMLYATSSLPGADISSKTTDLLTPFLLSLFSQLFSENAVSVNQIDGSDLPNGTPLKGSITQGSSNTHKAIDFGVPTGTTVHSTMSGKVVYAGWNNEGYGNLVIVENGNYRSYYAHLSEIRKKVGDDVIAGNEIGLSGNTGNSTGPHLHYEVRKNGVAIDPSTTLSDQ